ncbi:MAG: folate-binding protein [Aquabacterium sp.]|nr:MAG: folate-binding protein [Aquabacterium sp.]
MTATDFDGAVRLSHLGVIRAAGADAASFLHNQLTQDVEHQDAHQARLAAYCSAKGRMLASLLVLRPAAEEVLLVAATDLLPALVKRLGMFVLRAKARLADASAEVALVGLAGASARAWLGAAAEGATWSVTEHAQGRLVRLPDGRAQEQPQPRWLWLGAPEAAAALQAALPALPAERWQWLELTTGVPGIVQATAEQFVPQMINFELVGGVNFKKGCYPGQEIVARSQYLGKLKRRAALYHSDAPMQPAQEVFSAADPGQPSGMVVNAAPNPAGGWSALVEIKLAAREGDLHLGAADGPALRLGQLPYAVTEELDAVS